MGLSQNNHPARTSPHVCLPDWHGLIQTRDPAWTESSPCMLVQSINQVVDRMERIFECRGWLCCELYMLQNCLKTSSGQVSMQTKWGTTKRVWSVIQLKHFSWHSLCCCKKENNCHEPQKLTPCKWVRKGLLVAWRMVVLKFSSSKKRRKKPNTVCIDGSALTKQGWTSLTPVTLKASYDSPPQVGKCHQRHCH